MSNMKALARLGAGSEQLLQACLLPDRKALVSA